MTARLARLTRPTMVAICAMVVLVVTGTTAAIATTSAAPTTVSITGTISDPGGYPLAGIKIELYRDGADEGTYLSTTTTNDAGRYRFNGVEAVSGEPYRVQGTDPTGAHVSLYYSFDVGPKATTTQNATMKVAGFIQGKVSTKDGTAPAQPGRHVSVSAEAENATGGARVSAKGRFRMGGLPSGKYTLEFLDPHFAYQCYSNVRTPLHQGCTGTTQVTVTAGHTTTITPQVLDHPNSELSGTVTDAQGKPLSDIEVDVYTDRNRRINLDEPTTKADGSWSVEIDYAGKVKIVARTNAGDPYRTTWYKNAADFAHATPVTVKDGSEIADLRIAMPTK